MVDVAPKRMSPLDRISGLPESIISDILSTLPTKDAVATSILSRSWRFRWTRITSFKFEKPKKSLYRDDAATTLDFSDFVNMVLLKHCGESINKFVLHWESPHFRSAYLNTWANVAIARNVRILDLKTLRSWLSSGQGEFYLPMSLYTSGTLEALKLEGPFLVKPPNMVCLPKLAEMELSYVIYESDESLPVLISGCLFLESLTISRFEKSDNMVVCSISCPTLKRLLIYFDCYPYFRYEHKDVELKINAPALEILKLGDHMSRHRSIQPRLSSVNRVSLSVICSDHNMIVEFLQSLGTVKFQTIEENRSAYSRHVLSVSFQGVARYQYESKLPWNRMMDVLDNCIKLEELEIWCFQSNNNHIGRGPRTSLSSLKCLTLRSFSGLKKEMEMLKFFLDHGLVLETVTLSSYHPQILVKKAKINRILNVVTKWPRASPACKIYWREFLGLESCFESDSDYDSLDEV